MKYPISLRAPIVGMMLLMGGSSSALDSAEDRGAKFLAAAQGVGGHFEANHGQIPSDAPFCFRGAAYRLDLRHRAIELRLPGNEVLLGGPMRITFDGAGEDVALTGASRLPFQVMHRTTVDGVRRGMSAIPTYASVVADEMYRGVDVRYHINRGRLEYDLVVAPRADPSVIALELAGAESLALTDAGDLSIEFPVGRITQHKPHVYQEVEGKHVVIDGRYVLNGDHGVGLELGAYDRNLPLVIDPILTVEIRRP